MGRKRFRNGDVFGVPLPDGTFIFGRVMLDLFPLVPKRLLPEDSPLTNLGEAVLVEMYRAVSRSEIYQPSEVLIHGEYVESYELGGSWPIVDHVPVDVRQVQFPETLIGFMHPEGQVAFECGEIRLPLPMSDAELQAIHILKTRDSAYLWHYVCLHELGRSNEIPVKYKRSFSPADYDLRYSQRRMEIYQFLPLDATDSYYGIACRAILYIARTSRAPMVDHTPRLPELDA